MKYNHTHISTPTRSRVAPHHLAVAGHPRLRDRLAARWLPGSLDRALASGVSPESTPALALRAQRLSDLSHRRLIAEGLRSFAGEGVEAQGPLDPRVLPDRAAVASARSELQRLADALAKPGPVSPRGVAEARILLTDGTGPLYNRTGGAEVRARALSAADDLAAAA